jgi:hypothetical protein
VLEELADLASAFADERHDHRIGLGAARDRAQERALAHAGAGEQTHALALAEREEAVDDAHPGCEWTAHRATFERRRRIAVDGDEVAIDRRTTVEGPAESVDHTSEQPGARPDVQRSTRGLHFVVRTHSSERAERHSNGFAALESDDLARERLAAPSNDYDISHANSWKRESQIQASYACHSARCANSRHTLEPRFEGFDVHGHGHAF